MVNKLVDTHAHLIKQFYGDNLEKVIKDNLLKMAYIFNVSFDLKTAIEILEISKKYEQIIPVVGIHPNHANEFDEKEIIELENLIVNNENIKAIGEIGLDYHYKHNKKNQSKNFFMQLELAKKYKLPVIIHSRDSLEDIYKTIKNYPKVKFLIHSWSGDQKMLNKFLKHSNFWFGFNGVITFKNGFPQKEVIKNIPLDKILFETDCPYLTPIPHRGKTNYPSYVKFVVEEASKILNIDYKKLEKISYDNVKSFFSL